MRLRFERDDLLETNTQMKKKSLLYSDFRFSKQLLGEFVWRKRPGETTGPDPLELAGFLSIVGGSKFYHLPKTNTEKL